MSGSALAVLVLGGLAACGDDSSSDDAGGSSGATTTAGPTTTTTQPPATDTEEALAAVQDLADEGARLLEELYKDPTAIDDPDNDYDEQYAELFTDDSATPDSVFDHLRDFVDESEWMLAGPSGIFSEFYLYAPEPDGEDTLRFLHCVIEDREAHDENGPLGDDAAFTRRILGDGEAHRVDGVWRLHRYTTRGEPSERNPDLLQSGACETELEILPELSDPENEEDEQ